MALIVEYHVVADMYPIGASITAGMAVSLNAAAQAVPCPTATSEEFIIGVAGDSALAAAGQTTAYSAQVYIGANGATTRWTENRVSDFYDETAASQKITVYNGGGKFWISEDLFETPNAIDPVTNCLLQVSTTVAGEWAHTATAGREAARALGANQAYPSGVPGTTTTDGSTSLGNFIPVLLRV